MKKWFFCLVVYVILVGCTPGDIITIERPPQSDPLLAHTATPHLPPTETATNVPLRETVTPDPAGQILDGTSWVLTHHLIEGEVRELKNYETLVMSFGPERVGIYDGCNRLGYEMETAVQFMLLPRRESSFFPWENGKQMSHIRSHILPSSPVMLLTKKQARSVRSVYEILGPCLNNLSLMN